jgi:hypothetical protein
MQCRHCLHALGCKGSSNRRVCRHVGLHTCYFGVMCGTFEVYTMISLHLVTASHLFVPSDLWIKKSPWEQSPSVFPVAVSRH